MVGIKVTRETNEAELIRMMVGRTLELDPSAHPELPAGDRPTLLRAKGLSRAPLLKDANIELRAGEIVGLAGLIGSGRSELAQAIFGVAPQDSGTVEVDGKLVRIHRPEDAIALGIAYVPEDRQRQGLVTAMTVSQNIGLTASGKWFVDRFLISRRKKNGHSVYRLASDQDPFNSPVGSKLIRRQPTKNCHFKMARHQTSNINRDEPTRGIDVGARAEIYRLLDALAREDNLAILSHLE